MSLTALTKDLVCPYSEDHIVARSAMPKHLVKCRKGHPTFGRAICPYNEAHIIPLLEFEVHTSFCINKFATPQAKIKKRKSISSIPITTRQIEPSEDWDASEECPAGGAGDLTMRVVSSARASSTPGPKPQIYWSSSSSSSISSQSTNSSKSSEEEPNKKKFKSM